MNVKQRMSPVTALFLGLFGVGAVGIAAGTSVVLYGLRVINTQADGIIDFAAAGLTELNEVVQGLPPSIGQLLQAERSPSYAGHVEVKADLVLDKRWGGVRPAIKVTNNGDSVIALLAVRVAALDSRGVPVREWTEVVATPIAVEGDWRGPIMPHQVSYVVLSARGNGTNAASDADLTIVADVSDVWLWRPEATQVTQRMDHSALKDGHSSAQ